MIKTLAILLFVASQGAFAGWVDTKGNVIKETENTKSIGNFGVQLVLTANEAEFLKSWNQPTDPPILRTADTVHRGSPIIAIIIFSGCKPDAQKKCNVTVKYKIYSPDGTSSETAESPVWLASAPRERLLQLGNARLGVVVEKNEPIGKYRVEATVKDNVSGSTLKLATVFNATN